MGSLALVVVNLMVVMYRKSRSVETAPPDWSLLFASKLVKEIDRRHCWRSSVRARCR
jgi:hypothetical protein